MSRGQSPRQGRCRQARDGRSAARIEEEVVVTATGCEVITRFPAEELLVTAGGQYTVGGQVPGTREAQSNLNTNGRVAGAEVRP